MMSETMTMQDFLRWVLIIMALIGAPYYIEHLVSVAARAWYREKLRNHHAMIAETFKRS